MDADLAAFDRDGKVIAGFRDGNAEALQRAESFMKAQFVDTPDAAARELLTRARPDAVVCANDEVALGDDQRAGLPRDLLEAVRGEVVTFVDDNVTVVGDAVVNLAGESIFGRWTAAKKRRMASSLTQPPSPPAFGGPARRPEASPRRPESRGPLPRACRPRRAPR